MKTKYLAHTVDEMQELGMALSKELSAPILCYFSGDLGAGKTTLIQGLLKGYGYAGAVTSPTYNLVHEYPLEDKTVYHLDLYRLQTDEELEALGFRDLFSDSSVLLVEWPQKAEAVLPEPDYYIQINKQDGVRTVELRTG